MQNRSRHDGFVILYPALFQEYKEKDFFINDIVTFHAKKIGIWFDFPEKTYLFKFNLSCRGINDSSKGYFTMKRIIERGKFCGYEGILDIGGYPFSSDGIIQN